MTYLALMLVFLALLFTTKIGLPLVLILVAARLVGDFVPPQWNYVLPRKRRAVALAARAYAEWGESKRFRARVYRTDVERCVVVVSP